MSDNPYRLPRTVLPHRYTLALEPDLAAASFVGHVVIDANAAEAADRIILNAAELGIDSARVDGEDVPFTLDEATERLLIDRPVQPGSVTLEITFTGTLNDKLRGWYRSTYTDADGNQQVIATSQIKDFLGLRMDAVPAEFIPKVRALAGALRPVVPGGCSFAGRWLVRRLVFVETGAARKGDPGLDHSRAFVADRRPVRRDQIVGVERMQDIRR